VLDTDPYGPPQDNLAVDQQQRWLPHPSAVQQAEALLAAVPEADLAVIPLFQPGKTRGQWTSGQQVCTVHGAVLLAQNTANPAGLVPGLNRVRDMASRIAARELLTWVAAHPDRPDGPLGTVGWASVGRDGHVAVTEDCLTPAELASDTPAAEICERSQGPGA
jgi:hypothetical protein